MLYETDFGTLPKVLVPKNNCAVFFPYFDNNGKFGCFVFEQGKEISLEKFVKKYKDAYIHLERVKSLEAFFPYEKK